MKFTYSYFVISIIIFKSNPPPPSKIFSFPKTIGNPGPRLNKPLVWGSITVKINWCLQVCVRGGGGGGALVCVHACVYGSCLAQNSASITTTGAPEPVRSVRSSPDQLVGHQRLFTAKDSTCILIVHVSL